MTGAGWGEKTAERLVQRNGYRDRGWETRAVSVEEGLLLATIGLGAPSTGVQHQESDRRGSDGRLEPKDP